MYDEQGFVMYRCLASVVFVALFWISATKAWAQSLSFYPDIEQGSSTWLVSPTVWASLAPVPPTAIAYDCGRFGGVLETFAHLPGLGRAIHNVEGAAANTTTVELNGTRRRTSSPYPASARSRAAAQAPSPMTISGTFCTSTLSSQPNKVLVEFRGTITNPTGTEVSPCPGQHSSTTPIVTVRENDGYGMLQLLRSN